MTSYPLVYSGLEGALATLFSDKISNQIMRAAVLLQLLPIEPVRGKNVTWDAEVLGSGISPTVNAGVIADGAAVTAYSNDTYAPATLELGIYNDAIQLSGLAIEAAANTGDPGDLENLFGRKIMESSRRVALSINNDLFNGSTGGGIVGLTGALLSSGSYANVSISTYPSWASNLLFNGSVPRALTISLMRSAIQAVYQTSGLHPDLIVMNPAQWNEFGQLVSPQRFFQQDVSLRGEKITLDPGFNYLMFDSVPVIQDNSCPAGQAFFLTTSECSLRVMPIVAPEELGLDTTLTGLSGDPEYQFGSPSTRVGAKINRLAQTGDAFPFQLITYLQLQVMRPNAFAILGDLV